MISQFLACDVLDSRGFAVVAEVVAAAVPLLFLPVALWPVRSFFFCS